MGNVNVLVTFPLADAALDRIRAVDERLRVSPYQYVETQEERTARRTLRFELLGTHTRIVPEEFKKLLAEAEIIMCHELPSDVVTKAPRLKWVQLIGAGVEHLAGTGVLESSVTLTNMAGLASRPIAEYVLGVMIMHSKHLIEYVNEMPQRVWNRRGGNDLRDKTVGIVGLGHIGSEVAYLCKAFGMNVLASKKHISTGSTPNVDRLFAPPELKAMLALCDFVVISVAITPETRRLIGQTELKAMKRSAFLVNVARGDAIDQAALVRAMKESWVAGAALDVFDPEPLPKDSPLWNLPNTFLTPHCSASFSTYQSRLVEAFRENLKHYLSNEPLSNLVDRTRGY